jgi:F0F1-type ATP synthase alpha subunit
MLLRGRPVQLRRPLRVGLARFRDLEAFAAIWIGTSGSIDDVPVADVRRFEKEFISFLKTDHAGESW